MILSPRLHLFEINDQPWWPHSLRLCVQSSLTLVWSICLPLIQVSSPATLVARTLLRVLGRATITDYVYVDFASGAGGPTPFIEWELNRSIGGEGEKGEEKAMFVLTDLHPHVQAWEGAAKKSDNLSFVAEGVDAVDAPRDLLERAVGEGGRRRVGRGQMGKEEEKKKKVMRLFSLAFHHFDDELAEGILRNTIETSDGFGIFELQSRTISSLITVFLFGPLLAVITPYYFWNRPIHLFFTYIIPLIPFCLVYDGYISSLRTRTPEEVAALLRKANGGKRLEGWRFLSGEEAHTWPTGWMSWVICVRE